MVKAFCLDDFQNSKYFIIYDQGLLLKIRQSLEALSTGRLSKEVCLTSEMRQLLIALLATVSSVAV